MSKFGFLARASLVLLTLNSISHASDKTFTFRISGQPQTLDWNRAHTSVETHLLMNLMEGLVQFDSALKVVPAQAKSWLVVDDGRTYIFKLRTDIKWSDGVPVKAQDFVYSWKRLLAPLTAAPYAYLLFDIEGAEAYNSGKNRDFSQVGIQALDSHTLKVKLVRPVAHWIQIPTFWVPFPLREDLVQKYGEDWTKPGNLVTTGPFKLERYEQSQKIVLTSNSNYKDSRGNVDRVVALIVKENTAALSLYETGKLDFVSELPSLDLKRLAGRRDLKTFPYLKTGYLGFNVSKFPMSNARVRRAIAMAIDKSKIPMVLQSGQEPATSFVPPRMMGYESRLGLKFDPVLARSELKLSGIDSSRPMEIELLSSNGDHEMTLVQWIQQELKKNLGLKVVLQPFDHKTFRAQLDLLSFPAFALTWSADFPDPDNFLSLFLSSSGNNKSGWKSESFDKLVIGARSQADFKKRSAIYAEAQKFLIEQEAVVIPLYYEPNLVLIKSRVKGLELNPLNYLYLRKLSVD